MSVMPHCAIDDDGVAVKYAMRWEACQVVHCAEHESRQMLQLVGQLGVGRSDEAYLPDTASRRLWARAYYGRSLHKIIFPNNMRPRKVVGSRPASHIHFCLFNHHPDGSHLLAPSTATRANLFMLAAVRCTTPCLPVLLACPPRREFGVLPLAGPVGG